MALWFRDRFWLAVVITGLVLWIDIVTPLVAIALYAIRERARRPAGAAPPA